MTLGVAPLMLAVLLATDHAVVVSLPDGGKVEWRRGEAPQLLVLPHPGEGWTKLAQRVSGSSRNAGELRSANESAATPLTGVRVRVPWSLLTGSLRVQCARVLFPRDRRTESGWEHEVLAPWGGDGESWWELADWFCGDGSHYPAIREANPALGLFPPSGSLILIPSALLLKEFAAAQPAAHEAGRPSGAPSPTPVPTVPTSAPFRGHPAPSPVPSPAGAPRAGNAERGPSAGASGLEFRDGEAVYHLRAGEALYSAVVVRFTGQLHASDVNASALEIARHSGISNVTAIPVGYPVRIPLDLLLPEFLPTGDPRRTAWEKDREELASIKRVIRAANLNGIHVILDAGHGGADTGAIADGVWESTYVYDVMDRLKRVLEEQTKATVWTTVQDPALARSKEPKDVLPQTRGQRLLVDPPYDLTDPTTGVHLRWILTNSLLQKLTRQKVSAERVVFVSIHADSLHPAVRGMMVYVPSRSLRGSHAPWQDVGYACRESRSLVAPRFAATFRSRAEALSTQLGDAIVRSADRSSVPVHAYEPVRSSVLRGGSRWVPAVLRYSLVPTSVLIEICNLNNEQDRQALLTWRFRERLAHSIAAGLAEGFSR